MGYFNRTCCISHKQGLCVISTHHYHSIFEFECYTVHAVQLFVQLHCCTAESTCSTPPLLQESLTPEERAFLLLFSATGLQLLTSTEERGAMSKTVQVRRDECVCGNGHLLAYVKMSIPRFMKTLHFAEVFSSVYQQFFFPL